MTEKQLFYPLLSVYFSLILGDLQKEKLQIVSIFRFGHKKRGLFQCPPKGRESILAVFLIVRMTPVIGFWAFEPYISNAVGVVISFSVKDSWSVVTCICE